MPLLFKGLHSTVLFHRPLQLSLGERGFFMSIQKFCDHFAHNFICNRLINKCPYDCAKYRLGRPGFLLLRLCSGQVSQE